MKVSTSNAEDNSKYLDIYQKVQSRVGLKEDAQYKELFNPKDPYGESLGYLAKRNFKRFVAVLYYLIEEKEMQYDVLVGAGDSGVSLAKITEMIYEQLGKTCPVTLYLPIIRWVPKWFHYSGQPTKLFDNSVLESLVKEKTNKLSKLTNVLFIDDEIKNGITAQASIKVVVDAIGKERISDDLTVVIIAEDQGFNPEKITNGYRCHFYPFATESGISNVLSYIVPWSIEKHIKECFGDDEISSKARLNSLLDLPSKNFERFEDHVIEKPEYTTKQLDKLKREVPNFIGLQREFVGLLSKWISEAINEYSK